MLIYATICLLVGIGWMNIIYHAWAKKNKFCIILICVWLGLQMADHIYKTDSILKEFIEGLTTQPKHEGADDE